MNRKFNCWLRVFVFKFKQILTPKLDRHPIKLDYSPAYLAS